MLPEKDNKFNKLSFYSADKGKIVQFTAPEARVLVVDDIITNLHVVKGLLTPYMMEVDLCQSGYEAIEAVKSKHYDIVFMDHRMPGIDGVETTEQIKALGDDDSYYSNLPIVALTADAVICVREIFLEHGFADYMSKPIDAVSMSTVLERWIPRKKQIGVDGSSKSADKSDSSHVAIELEGVNVKKGIRFSGGTVENFMEILSMFYEEAIEHKEDLTKSINSGDISKYTSNMHALKGALANIGAEELADLARELENAGYSRNLSYIEAFNMGFLTALEDLLHSVKVLISHEDDRESERFDTSVEEKN